MTNKTWEDIELENLTEQITFRIQASLKMLLPGAIQNEDGSIKFARRNIGDFIRKAIYEKLNNENNNSKELIDAIKEYNKLMSIVKPSASQIAKVDINKIRKATEMSLK